MVILDNFKGDILIHPLCKMFVNNKVNTNNNKFVYFKECIIIMLFVRVSDFPVQYVNVFEYGDIIILCGGNNLSLNQFDNVEINFNINNCEQK